MEGRTKKDNRAAYVRVPNPNQLEHPSKPSKRPQRPWLRRVTPSTPPSKFLFLAILYGPAHVLLRPKDYMVRTGPWAISKQPPRSGTGLKSRWARPYPPGPLHACRRKGHFSHRTLRPRPRTLEAHGATMGRTGPRATSREPYTPGNPHFLARGREVPKVLSLRWKRLPHLETSPDRALCLRKLHPNVVLEDDTVICSYHLSYGWDHLPLPPRPL